MPSRRHKEFRRKIHELFGITRSSPLHVRLYALALMSGVMRQGNSTWEIRGNTCEPHIYPRGEESLLANRWIKKHSDLAVMSFAQKIGHWQITGVPFIPAHLRQVPSLKEAILYEEPTDKWAHIVLSGKRGLTVAISPAWHHTVMRHGIQRDMRRVVQRAWDMRDYGDRLVWRCEYWDLSALGNDDDSWKRCTQHQGFVVKEQGFVVVDQALHRAVQIARRRIVNGAIRGIIQEANNVETS